MYRCFESFLLTLAQTILPVSGKPKIVFSGHVLFTSQKLSFVLNTIMEHRQYGVFMLNGFTSIGFIEGRK